MYDLVSCLFVVATLSATLILRLRLLPLRSYWSLALPLCPCPLVRSLLRLALCLLSTFAHTCLWAHGAWGVGSALVRCVVVCGARSSCLSLYAYI